MLSQYLRPPSNADDEPIPPYQDVSSFRIDRYPVDQSLPEFDAPESPTLIPLDLRRTLFFCIPANLDLGKYWTKVDNRLNKIRNCMNLSGVRRQLDFYEPQIDPNLLVRATAMGLSLEDILDLIASQKVQKNTYRFNQLLEKARQFTQTMQSFAGQLLNALEKRDGEELRRSNLGIK